jgi:predicted secreted acid phosphatase
MPQLVSYASSHGYQVFYITGRPQSQTDATIKDLTSAGYPAPPAGHVFLPGVVHDPLESLALIRTGAEWRTWFRSSSAAPSRADGKRQKPTLAADV